MKPVPLVTAELLAKTACDAIDKHAREFKHILGDQLPVLCGELKEFWRKEFDPTAQPIKDLIASGQAQASLANGLLQRNVRDHFASHVMAAELGNELPQLFEAAKLKPFNVHVSHLMPVGIPLQVVQPFPNLHYIEMHTDLVPLLTKDEKLAFLAYELGHTKFGHTASTRATEFVADEFSVELTRKPEALKSALDKMHEWGTSQAIQQAQQAYSKYLPDNGMKLAFDKAAVSMGNVLNSPRVRTVMEKLNLYLAKRMYGMEHPLISERKQAIDEVAGRLGISIPASGSNQRGYP